MEQVKTTIGSITFDRAGYDRDSDVLYLSVGEPRAAEGEETPEGHVLRYLPGTETIVGLTILGAQRLLDRDGSLTVTIAQPVAASADDLASALGST